MQRHTDQDAAGQPPLSYPHTSSGRCHSQVYFLPLAFEIHLPLEQKQLQDPFGKNQCQVPAEVSKN